MADFNSKKARFDTRFGFVWLPSSGKMFLPMKTIKELFRK
jgi:hypothetical protein